MHTLIDLEQIWRETIPPDHELSKKQKEKVIKLLKKTQENVKELLKLIKEGEK